MEKVQFCKKKSLLLVVEIIIFLMYSKSLKLFLSNSLKICDYYALPKCFFLFTRCANRACVNSVHI